MRLDPRVVAILHVLLAAGAVLRNGLLVWVGAFGCLAPPPSQPIGPTDPQAASALTPLFWGAPGRARNQGCTVTSPKNNWRQV